MKVTGMLLCPDLENAEPAQQHDALRIAACCGDATAQSKLGDCYRVGGEFTKHNYPNAVRWYALAAAQGDPDAQNNLGSMYLNGMGVPKDPVQAVMWYRRAATQGLAVAQFNLALRYLHGDGVDQRDEAAVAWLRRAVEQGLTEAVGQLGTLYRFGRGVPQDLPMASQLHVLAAEDGDAVALGNLQDYQHELEQLALGGNAVASLSLATMYDMGLAVQRDGPTALAWLAWGKAIRPACDEALRAELLEMYNRLAAGADKLVRQRAANLLKNMRSRLHASASVPIRAR